VLSGPTQLSLTIRLGPRLYAGASKRTAGEEVTVVRVDITCDLMDEDETGHVWAFLRDACD
jgi:hypothetical protein